VERGSPADRAGIRAYDVISAVGDREVSGRAWLINRVANARPGQELQFGVVRNGEEFQARLVVGQAPDPAIARPPTSDIDAFGLEVEDLSDDVARSMGYEGDHGVLITDVEPGSAASDAGFQWGDLILEINRKALRSQADYRRALERSQENEPVMFRIRRGEARVVLAARMP
jgi:serine protease Do